MAILTRNPRAGRWRVPLGAIGVFVLGATTIARQVPEPAMKAAFLYSFAKFTNWPSDSLAAGAPLVLCVSDADVAVALESIVAGRSIAQHSLQVVRVEADDPLFGCGILYVGSQPGSDTRQILARLQGTSVLTVSDRIGFATQGGVIELYVAGGQMRFAINRAAAARSRLQLSSQLLSLARVIPG